MELIRSLGWGTVVLESLRRMRGYVRALKPSHVCFVHVPKTGGETVETLLGINKNHRLARQRYDLHGYSACIVRNPYTRLFSWYSHLRRHMEFDPDDSNPLNDSSQCFNMLKRGVKLGPRAHRELAELHEFCDWVHLMLDNQDVYGEPYWGPLGRMTNYVYSEDGEQLVTDIFFFEQYNDQLSVYLHKLGRSELVERIAVTNFSKKANVNETYDERTRQRVYDYFRDDFQAFGYGPSLHNLNTAIVNPNVYLVT